VRAEQRERIYEARRAAHVARLGDRGFLPEAAERAVTAWEEEAAARGGLPRDAPTFWTEGEAWIAERGWH
jgi:hypothetical protein